MTGGLRDSRTCAWLGPMNSGNDGRLPIFCLPYAGGGSAMFYQWQRRMSADFQVLPVRLPGREARILEPSYHSVPELVSALAPAIIPFLHFPYALFGHSMGGLLAFELVRELRRRGFKEPVRLFISAAPAPQNPLPDGPTGHLSDSAFIIEVKRRYGGIPAQVLENPELLNLILPCLRADFQMIESYQYHEAPPLSCPIACYGGSTDSRTNAGQLEGWRCHTRSEFCMRFFPGDHFFFQDHPDVLPFAMSEELASDAFKGRW
jgi:surfactin synthase thioesterase subunit